LPQRKHKGSLKETPGGESLLPSPAVVLRMATTFAAVCACWVFFRANTWADSLWIHKTIASQFFDRADAYRLLAFLDSTPGAMATMYALTTFLIVEWLGRRHVHPLEILPAKRPVRWAAYTVAIWATILLIPEHAGQEF